jgi:hypothetical protein
VEVCPGRPPLSHEIGGNESEGTKLQTIDDLLVENCQPGDVILFDRHRKILPLDSYRLVVVLAGTLFAMQNDGKMRSVEAGAYDHCGEFDNVS